MRIGIDAKWYFEGPPSGRRVVRCLTDALIALDDKNEYFILLNSKHKNRKFPGSTRKNVTCCYVWAGNNLLSNVFVLPYFSSKHKLDVVLYQNFVSPFDSAKRIAYIHDVLFLSNPEFYTAYERLYFSPLKFLTKRSDRIITVSEEEKRRLLKYGYGNESTKIDVAYHGVDPTFKPIEEYSRETLNQIKVKYNLPEEFLLFVGRLNLRKNIDNLLRAIPHLKNKNIPLVIVGADNWKKSNHIEIIKILGIENRIVFTGAIYDELPIVYAMAKIFCFPSFAESFGLPPLEAMASGVPIVVSNTTALPEICGDAGTYVTPDKPEEIANEIDALLADSERQLEYRRKGVERAKKFTWEEAAKAVLKSFSSTFDSTDFEKAH
ncbi:MAG: glycosyltransferase family 4 protein [Bacteroidetes bacterium]|nr:glycosyltransferase family 4 protein [Bacteroidota bacterium]